MRHKQLFIDAIMDVLPDLPYRLVDNSFYIYKREIGVVICIGFDMFMGESDFIIYGGAESVCSDMMPLPNGALPVGCYDVNAYAQKRGLPAYANRNTSQTDGTPKRYSKTLLVPKLQQNMALLKALLLPDLLRIESLEDYYHFKAQADGMMNSVAIPFPTINTFYLCVHLGMLEQASHIYLRMHQKCDRSIALIHNNMMKGSDKKIIEALDRAWDRDPAVVSPFARHSMKAEAIGVVLHENQAFLKMEAQRRIERSAAALHQFFQE